jgi:hypothetical protein
MVMKKLLRLLLFLLCGFCVVCSAAFPQDGAKKTNCAFTWTFYSNYIWQGLELNEASPFFFSSNSKSYNKALGFTPLQSFDSEYSNPIPWDNKEEGRKNYGILAYQDSFPLTDRTALNWRLGCLTYNAAGENEKALAGVGLNTFSSPGNNSWKGMELKPDAWTINFALSQNWDLSKGSSGANGWSLGLGSGVSYSNFNNVGYNDLQNANIWANINIPLKDGFSLTPSINYSFPMNDVKRNISGEGSLTGLESGFVFGGVALKIPY